MSIPWPSNTVFYIRSKAGFETWTVSFEADTANGQISAESPLGKSLLNAKNGGVKAIRLPDQKAFLYKVISIRPSGGKETQFTTALEFYVDAYRTDASGIRLNPHMKGICLECGHYTPGAGEGRTICIECGNWWYRDHCWNCKTYDVDSRDPTTPRCSRCRYWRCVHCGQCFCNSDFLWNHEY